MNDVQLSIVPTPSLTTYRQYLQRHRRQAQVKRRLSLIHWADPKPLTFIQDAFTSNLPDPTTKGLEFRQTRIFLTPYGVLFLFTRSISLVP